MAKGWDSTRVQNDKIGQIMFQWNGIDEGVVVIIHKHVGQVIKNDGI